MLNYDISRMKNRVEFGTTKTVTNPYSGVNESEFVTVMSLWCGEYTNTVSQTYTNLGVHTGYKMLENTDLKLSVFQHFFILVSY